MKRKRKPVFDPIAFLATAADGGKTVSKYRKDQLVFTQGETPDAVFYIQQGRVKLTVVSDQGKEAVVAMLGPGDFFGEGCLAGQPRRIATVAAMTECVVMRLEKAAMVRDPPRADLFRDVHLASHSS